MNLTKYEQLYHRHLSLLKALTDAGVSVKHDGGWRIDTPVRQAEDSTQLVASFTVDGRMHSHSVSSDAGDRNMYCAVPIGATHVHVAQAACEPGAKKMHSVSLRIDQKFPKLKLNDVIETYADGLWERTRAGEVRYVHRPASERPDWVVQRARKWGFDKGDDYDSFTVKRNGNTLSYALYRPHHLHMADSIVEMTDLQRHLLDALQSAILPASPAKVD